MAILHPKKQIKNILYDYNLYNNWQHAVRLMAILHPKKQIKNILYDYNLYKQLTKMPYN